MIAMSENLDHLRKLLTITLVLTLFHMKVTAIIVLTTAHQLQCFLTLIHSVHQIRKDRLATAQVRRAIIHQMPLNLGDSSSLSICVCVKVCHFILN